jgi:tetratricopeptide (TPR) repeat protein
MGNRLAGLGRPDHAIAQYRKALALDPDCAEAHNNLGVILYRQGRYDEAEVAYRRALVLVPGDADAHLNLGNVLFRQGLLDQAAAHYRQAVALSPDHAAAHLNLGVTLLHQDRLDAAAASIRRAVALDPDNADAHQNLGVVLSRLGRLDEAVACYRRALALNPDHADAQMNLGVALVDLDRLDEAVTWLRSALALAPDNARVQMNLGNVLVRQGRKEEAVECYRQAVALHPDDPEARYNLGVVLLQLDRLEEAVAHYQLALAVRPDDAGTLNNLGVALFGLGRHDEALVRYREALALKPDYVEAHYNLTDVRTLSRGDPDLTALEGLAAGVDRLPPTQAVYLHFALGKGLEDAGDYPRAFEHFLRGNALRRRLIRYDEAATREQFRRVARVFDAGLFERARGMGEPSSLPIFIVGMPRSGSTLVEQILASHPQIHGAGELTGLAEVASTGLGADQPAMAFPDYLVNLEGEALARLGRAYLARLPVPLAGRIRITDKMPNNFLLIGLIRLILPQARIIHTVRDPIDTCVSCFSKLFIELQDFSFDLAEVGRYYRWYHELMAHWRAVLPSGSLLEVRYETLVEDMEAQARRLIAYCDLPWDEGCLAFHRTRRAIRTASAVQVRQPLFRSSMGRWRRFRPYLQPLLSELAAIVPDRGDE